MADPRAVAVVGLGIGRMHVRAYRRLRDDFRVAAVCDVNVEVANDVAERIGATVMPFDAIVDDPSIDVVDICTPPALHRDQVIAALGGGKHVVCEKPLVDSLADVDAIAEAEHESPGRLMPIFQYRYGRGLRELRALVDAGVAGSAYTASVELAWRRRADYYAVPWRGRWDTELGGVLLNHAIHLLDMLTYIAGPPSRVFCRTSTRVNPIEVEDCASATLEMADGSLASITATLGSPQEITRHRFHFANLSAESGTEPYNSSAAPWLITPDTDDARVEIERVLASVADRRDAWEGQFEAFAASLAAGEAPPVTLADARGAIELVTALYASARSGSDVALPINPDDPFYRGWQP